jgi:drug/metabolite transporter (DMT)-like permease
MARSFICPGDSDGGSHGLGCLGHPDDDLSRCIPCRTAIFFNGEGLSELQNLTWNGWLGVLFLGIFCSGLAYIFWYDAVKALPAGQTGSFLFIEPFVTVVAANLVLSEPLIRSVTAGGLIILLGVWFVNKPVSSREHTDID